MPGRGDSNAIEYPLASRRAGMQRSRTGRSSPLSAFGPRGQDTNAANRARAAARTHVRSRLATARSRFHEAWTLQHTRQLLNAAARRSLLSISLSLYVCVCVCTWTIRRERGAAGTGGAVCRTVGARTPVTSDEIRGTRVPRASGSRMCSQPFECD